MLTISGVDIGVFKGHSTRSASTSKSALSWLSVPDILERGCCSNSSTWRKFYNKQIELPFRDFKFLINGFEQGVGSGLKYYLRAEFAEYSIWSYGGFMKQNFKITKGREAPASRTEIWFISFFSI